MSEQQLLVDIPLRMNCIKIFFFPGTSVCDQILDTNDIPISLSCIQSTAVETDIER